MPFRLKDSFSMPLHVICSPTWDIIHTDKPDEVFCSYKFSLPHTSFSAYKEYMAGVKAKAQSVVDFLNSKVKTETGT